MIIVHNSYFPAQLIGRDPAVCMIKDDSGEEMDRKIYFGYLAMSVLEPRNHPLQSHDEILYQNLCFGTLMCNPMQFLMSLHLGTGH